MTRKTRVALFWTVIGVLAAAALFFAPLLNTHHSFGESSILMWEFLGLLIGFILAFVGTAIGLMVFWDWAHKDK